MSRLGVFGGTFDPIHVGHLFIANAVRCEARLDRVLFLPVGEPAHRTAHAAVADRVRMVSLAIAGNEAFTLEGTAVHQPGPVYTADTLPLLRAAYPEDDFFFIAGSDSLVDTAWRRLDEVAAALTRFYVVGRDGASPKRLEKTLEAVPEKLAGRFVWMTLPFVDVSSSQIRARVAAGKPIRYLVTEAVERYIQELALYRGD